MNSGLFLTIFFFCYPLVKPPSVTGLRTMRIKKPAIAVRLALVMAVATGLACAAQAPSTPPAPVTGPNQLPYAQLRMGIESYEAGEYRAAADGFDRLLALLTPVDSQLAFIGLYYGIRSRLALGLDESADSLHDALLSRVPESQRPELLIALGRIEPGPEHVAVKEPDAVCRKIAVILPLSGRFADFGQAILEGVQLAVDGFNRGRQEAEHVVFEALDDQSDPMVAASLGRRAASDNTVAALIGSFQDDASLSLGLVASSASIPLLCPTAESYSLAELGPMVHAINIQNPEEMHELASFAVRDLGLQMFAILAPETEKGGLLTENFRRAVNRAGGVVVSVGEYSESSGNYEEQMTILQRYLPDAIYIPAETNDITQIASQIHYYGLGQARILGTENWRSARVMRMGGDYVDGALFASSFHEESESLRWAEFKGLYESTFRRPVNRYSALGFDAASLILAAAGSFPVSRGYLATSLNGIRDFSGAYSQYSIREDGVVRRRTYILQLDSGEVIPAEAGNVGQEPVQDPFENPSENHGTAP